MRPSVRPAVLGAIDVNRCEQMHKALVALPAELARPLPTAAADRGVEHGRPAARAAASARARLAHRAARTAVRPRPCGETRACATRPGPGATARAVDLRAARDAHRGPVPSGALQEKPRVVLGLVVAPRHVIREGRRREPAAPAGEPADQVLAALAQDAGMWRLRRWLAPRPTHRLHPLGEEPRAALHAHRLQEVRAPARRN